MIPWGVHSSRHDGVAANIVLNEIRSDGLRQGDHGSFRCRISTTQGNTLNFRSKKFDKGTKIKILTFREEATEAMFIIEPPPFASNFGINA